LTNFSDSRAPGVAAADYAIISHGRFLLKAPLLSSANEIAHEECGRPPVMWYNFGCFQSNHTGSVRGVCVGSVSLSAVTTSSLYETSHYVWCGTYWTTVWTYLVGRRNSWVSPGQEVLCPRVETVWRQRERLVLSVG